MKRTILAILFQLLAVTGIILSLKPRLDLFFYEHNEHRYGYYDTYLNYFILRSWLIALAGIGVGLILFWLSGRIQSKMVIRQNAPSMPRSLSGRLIYAICLVVVAILATTFLPGLAGLLGGNDSDAHMPMTPSQKQAASQVFMIMSNDLTTPPVKFRRPASDAN